MKVQDYPNVLPNTYIPVLSKKVTTAILNRLPTSSLVELSLLWPKLVHTQPHLDKENHGKSQLHFNKWVIDDIKRLINDNQLKSPDSDHLIRKLPKQKLINKIVFEHWSLGLNLLQISQVDCQILVDRPNLYSWILSTIKDRGGKGSEVPISLDPQTFLNRLAKDLSEVYMSYIYVCKHPQYPMVIIRVQVFDLHRAGVTDKLPKPHISSYRPFFLAIPENSPKIIHTPGKSVVSRIIMQAVERSLKQDTTNLLALSETPNQKPVNSLKSMHIFNGSSRFGNSLGVWTPYADGTVDQLPLSTKLEGQKPKVPDSSLNELDQLKRIANVRFKGSETGNLVSEILYDVVNNGHKRKKTKRAVTYVVEDSDEEDFGTNQESRKQTEFSSIAPVQFVEFTIKDPTQSNRQDTTNITIKLSGEDVFAGLHELSTLTADKEKMVLNPATMPNWLTGEEGPNSGVITNGKFEKY